MWIVTLKALCKFAGADLIERSILVSQSSYLLGVYVSLEKCSIHIFLDCMYFISLKFYMKVSSMLEGPES